MFIAVSDSGARKNYYLKPDNSGSIFLTTTKQRSNPHSREGLTQLNSPLPTKNGQMPGGLHGMGGGDVEVSIRSEVSI